MTNTVTLEEVLKAACEAEHDMCVWVNANKDKARMVIDGDVALFNPWVDKAHLKLIKEICIMMEIQKGINREF